MDNKPTQISLTLEPIIIPDPIIISEPIISLEPTIISNEKIEIVNILSIKANKKGKNIINSKSKNKK